MFDLSIHSFIHSLQTVLGHWKREREKKECHSQKGVTNKPLRKAFTWLKTNKTWFDMSNKQKNSVYIKNKNPYKY